MNKKDFFAVLAILAFIAGLAASQYIFNMVRLWIESIF